MELYPVADGDESKPPKGVIDWQLTALDPDRLFFNERFMHVVQNREGRRPIMIQALSSADTDRLSGCLDRLIPHAQMDSLAMTGSVAMQLGLAVLGRQGAQEGNRGSRLGRCLHWSRQARRGRTVSGFPLPRRAARCPEVHDSTRRSEVAHHGSMCFLTLSGH